MSRKSDLGPLPMNWRDVFQSLFNLQQSINEKQQGSDESSSRSDLSKKQTNLLSSLSCGRLIRCGQLCTHHNRDIIGNPAVIINLRYSNDAEEAYHPSLLDDENVTLYHIPAENSLEKYNTGNRAVAKWIASGLRTIQNLSSSRHPNTTTPILIHCRSGRDRTGVLIAALLLALGIDASLIKSEFLLSTGSEERYIDQAIQGLIGLRNHNITDCKDMHQLPWLRGVDVNQLRNALLLSEQNCNHVEANSMDTELLYLRQQNQILEQRIMPLLETKTKRDYQNNTIIQQEEKTEAETILLHRINDISARQIFLFSLKRNVLLEEEYHLKSSNDDDDDDIPNVLIFSAARCKLSKRIAIAHARRGWSFKLLYQYKEAVLDFETAVREAEELSHQIMNAKTTESNNDGKSGDINQMDDQIICKWKVQIKILSKLVDSEIE